VPRIAEAISPASEFESPENSTAVFLPVLLRIIHSTMIIAITTMGMEMTRIFAILDASVHFVLTVVTTDFIFSFIY